MKALIIGIVLLVVLFMFGVQCSFEEGNGWIELEIPQDVGGTLIVEGNQWMDLRSFGNYVSLKFLHPDSFVPITIGDSNYYGREFDRTKQIVRFKEFYVLTAGDRLRGDKLFASKDLKNWREFSFNKPYRHTSEFENREEFFEYEKTSKVIEITQPENGVGLWHKTGFINDGNPALVVEYSIDWENPQLQLVLPGNQGQNK